LNCLLKFKLKNELGFGRFQVHLLHAHAGKPHWLHHWTAVKSETPDSTS
jgi:hypothetical protein